MGPISSPRRPSPLGVPALSSQCGPHWESPSTPAPGLCTFPSQGQQLRGNLALVVSAAACVSGTWRAEPACATLREGGSCSPGPHPGRIPARTTSHLHPGGLLGLHGPRPGSVWALRFIFIPISRRSPQSLPYPPLKLLQVCSEKVHNPKATHPRRKAHPPRSLSGGILAWDEQSHSRWPRPAQANPS